MSHGEENGWLDGCGSRKEVGKVVDGWKVRISNLMV